MESVMATLRLIFIYSVPVVIFLATLEALVLWFRERGEYDWRAYSASLADLLVRQYFIYTLLPVGLADPVIAWAWTHRTVTVPLNAVAAFVALFLGQEFCYYWFHRCNHRVRWLWATHAVHHSSNQLNLSAAYRFGWTGRLSGAPIFFRADGVARLSSTRRLCDLKSESALSVLVARRLGPEAWRS
jgi:sterol desaturase/sphingolipid hydroxylase (fatty acid hydroxylase superfamily)